MALLKFWIWDSGTSQHSSHNRSFFDNFEPLLNQSPVKGLGGEVIPVGISFIRVPCKRKQGQLAYLNLDKVLFMPGSGVNLMSQGQLQREGCLLAIVSEWIEIGNEKILAQLVNNNLYLPDLADPVFPSTAFAAINEYTLQLWHSRHGHLSKSNVLWLATMSKGIDLSKPPPADACPPFTRSGMKVETHKDPIQPGKAPLDLIYSDVHGLFPYSYDRAKYFVSFLDDWDKSSDIIVLGGKSDALAAFPLFQLRHERGDQRVHLLRTDNGGKYSFYKFEEHRDECGIIWEPTVSGNPQMNGSAEQLGQTIHRMANAPLSESRLPKKYWSEMVLTTNYLRNRMPVTGRDITQYESKTGLQPQLSHLRHIGQRGYAQDRKPQTE